MLLVKEALKVAAGRQIEITSLDDGAWETVTALARLDGKGFKIETVPTIPTANTAVSVPYRLSKGTVAAAAGTVGLLDVISYGISLCAATYVASRRIDGLSRGHAPGHRILRRSYRTAAALCWIAR
jgi:hypothetical protein